MRSSSSRLWRVENSVGLGPYQAEWPHRDAITDAHNDDAHPDPRDDFFGGAALAPSYLFAFATKTAARKWFRGWWRRLRAHGFALVERTDWRGFAHGRSGLQVAFRPLSGVPAVPSREVPF